MKAQGKIKILIYPKKRCMGHKGYFTYNRARANIDLNDVAYFPARKNKIWLSNVTCKFNWIRVAVRSGKFRACPKFSIKLLNIQNF